MNRPAPTAPMEPRVSGRHDLAWSTPADGIRVSRDRAAERQDFATAETCLISARSFVRLRPIGRPEKVGDLGSGSTKPHARSWTIGRH